MDGQARNNLWCQLRKGERTPDTMARTLIDHHRAEVLREAADFVDNDDICDCGGCDTCIPRRYAADLRRLADESTKED